MNVALSTPNAKFSTTPLYWVKAAINFDGENPEIAYEPSKADIFIANQVPGPEEDKD